ncbi:hypothetical protein AAVH_08270 [Aphelenchoides avenae]|nr:hypothetical protein AAVH_08270 [Aphelenchus avenae]
MTCLSLAVTYIYTDKVLLNVDNAINVLDLAKKYLLGPLEDRTASYITEHLMPQNVCFFLDSANLLGDVMKKTFSTQTTIDEKYVELVADIFSEECAPPSVAAMCPSARFD